MARILGLGDNVCDMYVHEKRMYPGGQALNVAVYSSMLGAQSQYMGTFGTDDVAACVKTALEELDIPFPRARCAEGTNGYAMVRLEEGDRVFIGSNRGGVAREQPLKLSREDVEYIAGFDVVHTSNNSWIDGELEKLDGIQTAVSYDFSGKWNEEERRNAVCPHIDYAFLSCGGLEPEQVRKVCGSMLHAGARAVVATMGGKGAMYADAAGEMIQPPEWVEPVDTLGAGDSFAAALLTALAPIGKPPKAGVERELLRHALSGAAHFAAQCCLKKGAFGYGRDISDERIERAMAGIIRL